jgi:hypothetical protein
MPLLETNPSFDKSLKTLEISAGKKGSYRVSQMDDYSGRPRRKYLHSPPLSITLQVRVSDNSLPGTWGFGFWNDPFALGIGVKGSGLHLPALPEAAWFFYGSAKNDLSFRSEEPKNGLLASVFTSTPIPSILLPFGLLALPLLASKSTARWLRRFASRFIKEDSVRCNIDDTIWHEYRVQWLENKVEFSIDSEVVLYSSISPRPPLGLVVWIDNQYAAFSVDGSVHFGTEENPSPAWIEIKNIEIAEKNKP